MAALCMSFCVNVLFRLDFLDCNKMDQELIVSKLDLVWCQQQGYLKGTEEVI